MYRINSYECEEEYTEGQIKTISTVMKNVNDIIDLEGLKDYCSKYHVDEVIIFGSRTRLHENNDSDLDIMVSAYSYEFSQENYIREQREFINNLYDEFRPFVKNHSVELDFKLNISSDDTYAGITHGTEDTSDGYNDYILTWDDMPSFISITPDEVCFSVFHYVSTVFEGDEFAELIY